jgi:hypothetical protein
MLTASLILIAMAGTAVAGKFEEATAAFDRGDYVTARQLWYSLADFWQCQGAGQTRHNVPRSKRVPFLDAPSGQS